MRRRLVVRLVVSIACAGAAYGCTSPSQQSGPVLTNDQFVQAADAICATDSATIVAAAVQLGDSPTRLQQQQWVTTTVVPLYTHTVSAIGALKPPKEIAAKVAAWLTAFKKEVASAKSNPGAMLDGTGGLPSVFNRARDLGLLACGEAPKK
jgi:hypothetical protein